MTEKIIFNGRIYRSIDEMPQKVRERYDQINLLFKDSNRDGVPDFIQDEGLKGIKEVYDFIKDISKSPQDGSRINPDQVTAIHITDSSIVINGHEFKNTDEMPPVLREEYERIISEVDPSEFDIYEEPWRRRPRSSYFEPHDDESIPSWASTLKDAPSIMQEVNSSNTLIILIAVVAVILCGVAVWLLSSNVMQGL